MSTCRVLVLPRQVRTHFCVRMTEGSSRKARDFFYFGRNSRAESERVQSARRFGGLAKPSKEESCQGVWGGGAASPPHHITCGALIRRFGGRSPPSLNLRSTKSYCVTRFIFREAKKLSRHIESSIYINAFSWRGLGGRAANPPITNKGLYTLFL